MWAYRAGAVWVLSWHRACPSGVAALSLGWFSFVLLPLLTYSTPCFFRAEGRNPSSRAEPCPFGRPFNRGTPLLETTYHYTHCITRYSPTVKSFTNHVPTRRRADNHPNYKLSNTKTDNPVTGCGDLWSVIYIYAPVNCRHKHFEIRLYTSVEPCEAIV